MALTDVVSLEYESTATITDCNLDFFRENVFEGDGATAGTSNTCPKIPTASHMIIDYSTSDTWTRASAVVGCDQFFGPQESAQWTCTTHGRWSATAGCFDTLGWTDQQSPRSQPPYITCAEAVADCTGQGSYSACSLCRMSTVVWTLWRTSKLSRLPITLQRVLFTCYMRMWLPLQC